jgi:Ca2+-binding EF-hand superfamily protein
VRKVLATQARAAGVEPIEDFSIGFDDFSAAVEMAGVSATRMQMAAVFALIDADKCGIITLQELVTYLRREGFRVSAFRSKSVTRETEKARRALSEIFDHVVEVITFSPITQVLHPTLQNTFPFYSLLHLSHGRDIDHARNTANLSPTAHNLLVTYEPGHGVLGLAWQQFYNSSRHWSWLALSQSSRP